MKKVIRCNDTQVIPKKDWGSIQYDFVSDDGLTPSSVKICLGDPDPMTGEPLADLTLFEKYHQFGYRQVRTNLKQIRPERTKKELAARRQAGREVAEEFEKRYGYPPSKDDVAYLLEEREGSRNAVSLDAMRNSEGESCLENIRVASVPFEDPFDDGLSVQERAFYMVTESLTGRLKEVLEVLVGKTDENGKKLRLQDLAAKWNVSPATVTKYKEKIFDLVRQKAAELVNE